MTDATRVKLSREESAERLIALHEDWSIDATGKRLERRISCRGFAKAVYLANLAAFHADKLHHHPDIAFGVGYCAIRYTTHDVDGLSEKDFAAALGLDHLMG